MAAPMTSTCTQACKFIDYGVEILSEIFDGSHDRCSRVLRAEIYNGREIT
jgi:hypothetical protein